MDMYVMANSSLFLIFQGAMGDAEYIYAFHQIIVPIAYEYLPELVIISAGFDSGRGDPLVSAAPFLLSMFRC